MGQTNRKQKPECTNAEVAEMVEKHEEEQDEESEYVQENMKTSESNENVDEEMKESQEALAKKEEKSDQEEEEPDVKKFKKTSKRTEASSRKTLSTVSQQKLESFNTLLPRLKHDPENDISDEDFKKMFHALCTKADEIAETMAKHEEKQMEESEYVQKVTKRGRSDKCAADKMKESREVTSKKNEKQGTRDQQLKRTTKRFEGREQERWEESDQEEWEESKPVLKKAKTKSKGNGVSNRKKPSASELPRKLESLGALLPSLKHDPNNVISDDDLNKLFHALCPDTDKLYDSDDSIISEIDGLSAAELADGTARCREAMEYIRALPEKMKAVDVILNQGNETKKEREDRKKAIREITHGLKTKDEKARAERIFQREKKKLEKSFATVVQVFDKDECKTLCSDSELPLQINEADFEKKLKEGLYRGNFFTNGQTKAQYLKTRIAKIFEHKEVLEVLATDRYGFEFSTREAILVLAKYYNPNPLKQDNGLLQINIKELAAAAYIAFRSAGREMPKINEPLRMALGY
ncbi:hypothetical protein L5515_018531 [Caenorhabditis briggsae]|uniref:Uncharacterized protein n=1 Tax=Caenorhabditis briggsae TaxID=6238 RepID=A0AAE9FMF1_CAEBR|nr:hypothetical protein L5515_018531 [Caenorhabditis briggsae]